MPVSRSRRPLGLVIGKHVVELLAIASLSMPLSIMYGRTNMVEQSPQ